MRTSPSVPWQGIIDSGVRPLVTLPSAASVSVAAEKPWKVPCLTPASTEALAWLIDERVPEAVFETTSALAWAKAPSSLARFLVVPSEMVARPGMTIGWPGVGMSNSCGSPTAGV